MSGDFVKKELTVGKGNAIIKTPSKILGIKIVGIKKETRVKGP